MVERESLVASVAQKAIEKMHGECLVVNDPTSQLFVPNAKRWSRYAFQRKPASIWPEGSFDQILIRLHTDKNAMDLLLHASLSVLKDDGVLWIVGANDEGIKSVPKRLLSLCEDVETIDIRKRCRILRAKKKNAVELQDDIADWWKSETFLDQTWKSLPGCFAKGRLDAGTQLLLDVLPSLKTTRRVLDFACGIGVVASQIHKNFPDVPIDGLDHDVMSIHAARENLSSAQFFVSDGLHSLPNDRRYDLIVSNPPFHRGKSEERNLLEDFVISAKPRLFRQSRLVLVTRRQIPVQKLLKNHLNKVEMLKKNKHFWVWKAQP